MVEVPQSKNVKPEMNEGSEEEEKQTAVQLDNEIVVDEYTAA